MALATQRGTPTVALIGNPNTGKSTLFSALAGVQQRVGNYPGVTVEKKLGQMTHAGRRWTLVDLPGTYSLAPRSPDEMVAVDVLLGRRADAAEPDVVLCKCFQRPRKLLGGRLRSAIVAAHTEGPVERFEAAMVLPFVTVL